MTSVYCRFLSIFQLRERQHFSSCFVLVESIIMLGAINKKNGGTHDTNIQVYEHTGKKLKRIKYSRLCVSVPVCVCVHKYI